MLVWTIDVNKDGQQFLPLQRKRSPGMSAAILEWWHHLAFVQLWLADGARGISTVPYPYTSHDAEHSEQVLGPHSSINLIDLKLQRPIIPPQASTKTSVDCGGKFDVHLWGFSLAHVLSDIIEGEGMVPILQPATWRRVSCFTWWWGGACLNQWNTVWTQSVCWAQSS